jgi:hypothetical protein
MKAIIIYVLTHSLQSLSALATADIVSLKESIVSNYSPLKRILSFISLLCSAHILFSISPYAEAALGQSVFSTINPFFVFLSFASINLCLLLKFRLAKVNDIASTIIQSRNELSTFPDASSNDCSWDNAVTSANPKNSNAAA